MHRSVALALLLKQRGFMNACDATLAPHGIPVFRDLAGSDRAAAAAAIPEIRLVNAYVCKVGGGGGEVVLIVKVLTLLARCVTPRVAACQCMKRTSKASATPRKWQSFWRYMTATTPCPTCILSAATKRPALRGVMMARTLEEGAMMARTLFSLSICPPPKND